MFQKSTSQLRSAVGKKAAAGRQILQMDLSHLADVYEAGKENHRQRRAVVLQEHPNGMLEQTLPCPSSPQMYATMNTRRETTTER